MKTTFLSSIVLAALCATIAARSSGGGESLTLVCGSSLSDARTLPVGHTVTLGAYDSKDDAIDALQSEEGMQSIGDQLAADALEGVSCDACIYTADGLCPGEVFVWGWEEGDVAAKVRYDEDTEQWIAFAELAAEISFGLTCHECVPGDDNSGD